MGRRDGRCIVRIGQTVLKDGKIERRGSKHWRVSVPVPVACVEELPEATEGKEPPPWTELREFYTYLRQASNRYVVNPLASLMAGGCKEGACPGVRFLEELFARSFEQFRKFSNIDEDFMPEQCRREPREDPKEFAIRLVTWLEKSSNSKTALPLKYVAREINPRRVTAAGARESGTGGMDVLFATTTEPSLPVIGEIKADSDRPIFLALVQSLAYAVEMVTDNQVQRLVNSRKYGEQFRQIASSESSHRAEICLLLEKGSREKAKRMEAVAGLAKRLMGNKRSLLCQKIRAISCYEARLARSGAEFALRFRHESVTSKRLSGG